MQGRTNTGGTRNEVARAKPSVHFPPTLEVEPQGKPCPEGSRRTEPASNADLTPGDRPFFVLRPPEEYSRLESVESSLTLLLRRQALQEEKNGQAGSPLRCCSTSASGDTHRSKHLAVRIHVPPYDEDSVLTLTVPRTMRVADLRDKVVQEHLAQHPSAASASRPGLCELRLYDEDEEEPDFDCPPFDYNLQVGCLSVADIALCFEVQSCDTPPSPLQSAPGSDEKHGTVLLSPEAVTPKADAGIAANKSHQKSPEVADAGTEAKVAGSHRRTRSVPLAPPCVPSFLSSEHSGLQECEVPRVCSHNDLSALCRQQPAPAFFFNGYTASIATEYMVTVAVRGSRALPSACVLVVDREWLHHRAPRGGSVGGRKEQRKGSFVPPLLKKLGRHLARPDSSRSDESSIFLDRSVHDIRSMSAEEDERAASLTFSVTYESAGGPCDGSGLVELTYQVQTPTEFEEVVARLRFLRRLLAK
eukprot:TRINITY_DN91087_c0_g1_i1.p1 TRINITY_DN91087_c0_g1~~TRINITY_DN91087_c0_g1_i1.p1  ORF type:complete len:510 (-),score=58.94 TRINITY_DN91087_c0_g1_i1:18-1439(-)